MKGGSQFRQWTTEAYLLASMVNLTFSANRQRAGKPTRKAPIVPPKISTSLQKKANPKRVVNISKLPSARRRLSNQ